MTDSKNINNHASDFDLASLADKMRAGLEITDRRYRLKVYKSCFVGSDACTWLVKEGYATTLDESQALGQLLLEAGYFHHVVRDHGFKNEYLFYRFAEDEDHGHVRKGEAFPDWSDLMGTERTSFSDACLLPEISSVAEEVQDYGRQESWSIEPADEHNARLLGNVRPRTWKNPTPNGDYNLVVIGAGAGGLVTAAGAAGIGAKVALIEEHFLGGDCLNFGCVPSKALLSAAKVAATVKGAAAYGVKVKGEVEVDFNAVMTRLRKIRADISPHDSAERFAALGIDVFLGRATFTGPNSVEVDGQTLNFKKCCIATGGRPALPAIPGIKDVPFLTNMTLYNLTEQPARLGIIGSGVVGVEMAQAFQRLGTQVTLFARGDCILSREEADARHIIRTALEADGVQFVFNSQYTGIESQSLAEGNTITVKLEGGKTHEFDALLVATGRLPNVENMGLDVAGVKFCTHKGVEVNDYLQTANSDIFAVGDVATEFKFTHAADFMARLVIRNALFPGKGKFSNLLIPWAIYTEPELAHVGLYERDLKRQSIPYSVLQKDFADVDRCKLEGKKKGYVRVLVKQGSDRILGATIVGDGAGDLISEITMAMHNDVGLKQIASVIHPYPTSAEAIRQLGDLFGRSRLTPTVKKIMRGLLDLQRSIG